MNVWIDNLSMSLWRVLFVLGIILEVFPAVNGLLFIPSSNYTYADRAASFGPRANQTQGTLIPLAWFNASNINCCEDMDLYPLVYFSFKLNFRF